MFGGARSAMAPVWRTQLWVPVAIPSMSGTLKTIIMDWDSVGDDEVRGGQRVVCHEEVGCCVGLVLVLYYKLLCCGCSLAYLLTLLYFPFLLLSFCFVLLCVK